MQTGILAGNAGVAQLAASELADNAEDRARTHASLATRL